MAKVVEALKAAGCTAVSEIEAERSGGFEVEGAICEGGKRFDIKLDKSFAVVSKSEDWL
jgi:hypothetical protein